MDNQWKEKIAYIMYIVLIVVIIAGVIGMFFWLRSESAMCLSDPISYAANKSNLQCYCMGIIK